MITDNPISSTPVSATIADTPNPPTSSNVTSTLPSNVPKPKAPILIIIIAWLLLISGIFSLLGVLPFLLLGGLTKIGVLLIIGIINLIRGIGLIVVSFGIRHMRRWALYAFTGITVLAIIVALYNFTTSPNKELANFIDVAIQVLILAYLWSISKRFV